VCWDCEIAVEDGEQKNVLVALLAINGVMFVLELTIGLFAE